MGAELSRIERDLVITSLIHDKPEIEISSLDVMASTQKLTAQQYSLLENKILFIPSSSAKAQYLDKERLSVFFYYKKRGMFFEAPVRIVKKGFAIVLPDQIYKQTDDNSSAAKGLSAVLFYSSGKNSDVQITAHSLEAVPLFDTNAVRSIPKELMDDVMKQRGRLYSADKKSALDDQSAVMLAHFFSRPALTKQSVEGRFQPLVIVYISDSAVIFGCGSPDIPLSMNAEYGIRIDFPLGKLVRPIYASVFVTKIIGDSDDVYDIKKTGAVCRFTSLKEEDKRLLFEKSRGTSYSVPFTASAPRK